MMLLPPLLFQVDPAISSIDEALEALAPLDLNWELERSPDGSQGGGIAKLYENPATGEIWAVAVLQNGSNNRHRHNAGGPYGELVISLAGELDETLDDGTPVKLCAPAVLIHGPDTTHKVFAKFWLGIYHQPFGSTPA